MRLATALDEIDPLSDPRVEANEAYLVILPDYWSLPTPLNWGLALAALTALLVAFGGRLGVRRIDQIEISAVSAVLPAELIRHADHCQNTERPG